MIHIVTSDRADLSLSGMECLLERWPLSLSLTDKKEPVMGRCGEIFWVAGIGVQRSWGGCKPGMVKDQKADMGVECGE